MSVVLPVLNEARGLGRTLPGMPAWIDELIIVDGGSTDKTIPTVERIAPHAVIVHQTGRGKGGALKEGIAASTGDIVVTMDGDGSMDPADIEPAIAALIAGADFVKGSRCLADAGSADFTRWRSFGNWALTRVANTLFGGGWTDITYGFNAYWRAIMLDPQMLSDGFAFEIQAAARAARSGLKLAEIATYEAPRVAGVSKLSPMADGWKILKVLLSEAKPSTSTGFRACSDFYLQPNGVSTLHLIRDQGVDGTTVPSVELLDIERIDVVRAR